MWRRCLGDLIRIRGGGIEAAGRVFKTYGAVQRNKDISYSVKYETLCRRTNDRRDTGPREGTGDYIYTDSTQHRAQIEKETRNTQ